MNLGPIGGDDPLHTAGDEALPEQLYPGYATLHAQARRHGLSVEDYIASLLTSDTPQGGGDDSCAEPEILHSGMVMEDGLLIYRTGRPLPAGVVDEAMRRSRKKRIAHIFGGRVDDPLR